jgi:signal transduction histidine kinase
MKRHRIDLQDCPGLPPVDVDGDKIHQVVANLLSNAIKYTPASGTITVRAVADHDYYRFDVADTGVGIPSEDLPKLFQEFFRANNQTGPEQQGTGLGLSLVKRIVEAHHGTIWVESQVNKGTTFSFTLPKQTPEGASR